MSLNKPVREKTMPQGGIELYVRDTFTSTRYRLGVIDDPAVEFAGEKKDVDYHNYSTKKIVEGQYYNVSLKEYELMPETLAILKKGLDNVVTYDGATPVVGQTETFESGDRGYAGDGSNMLNLTNITSITSVTGSVDGALTVTTDYTVTDFGTTGKHILTLVSGGTITTLDQTITIVYDATPLKATYDKPKATGTPTGFILETQRDGEDDTGATMQILTIYDDCKSDQFSETYAGDKDDKGAYNDLTIKGRCIEKKFVGFEA